MPEEVSGTFDPEVDLYDDAAGEISLRRRFYSVHSPIMRQKIKVFEDVRESPVEWGALGGTFACEVEATNSRTHFKEYLEVFHNS